MDEKKKGEPEGGATELAVQPTPAAGWLERVVTAVNPDARSGAPGNGLFLFFAAFFGFVSVMAGTGAVVSFVLGWGPEAIAGVVWMCACGLASAGFWGFRRRFMLNPPPPPEQLE